ncbi:MAG: prolyl-tRNA synthetase [Mycoplasmataceae bacterium RC_NB112A]|nr:MAG: prolyl-tRNA synthetase [Mycoplasmataceae bacterium RC_NB112A]KLL02151.1 MAG: prolyl-tRNA synthetase [Mycoplasmataceae bacterium RC_NB112A]
MKKEDKYIQLLKEAGLFFYGAAKGSFILPPRGYILWKSIQNILDHRFSQLGVKNVLLSTLIPYDLLAKEKEHVAGFSPECFYVEKIGAKKLTTPLILRPTSEVLFYEWYRQILRSYHQLPFLYNQWCSVFRAEKNTNPFFRNTEFLWQEGHTLHTSETEARQFALHIWKEYQFYAEKILGLGVIAGPKTEGEKFAGALKTYTVECLLPDGQCLQLATSHYFGDHFCRLMGVKYQDQNNQLQFAYSTSWGTSTRAVGAVAKTHADPWGLILPFAISPVQVAFILIEKNQELTDYYQEISSLLTLHYRCQLYDQSSQVNQNLLQADKEGCPFKIILGSAELKNREITLVRRDDIERRMTIKLEENEVEKSLFPLHAEFTEKMNKIVFPKQFPAELERRKTEMIKQFKKGIRSGKLFSAIGQEIEKFSQSLSKKSIEFRDSHIYRVENLAELEKKIKAGNLGLFLVPFCNNLECEKKIKERVLSYSIRCIAEKEKISQGEKCLFCFQTAKVKVYLGRSY